MREEERGAQVGGRQFSLESLPFVLWICFRRASVTTKTKANKKPRRKTAPIGIQSVSAPSAIVLLVWKNAASSKCNYAMDPACGCLSSGPSLHKNVLSQSKSMCHLTTASNSHLYVVNKKYFTFQQRYRVSPTHQRGQPGNPRSPPRKSRKKSEAQVSWQRSKGAFSTRVQGILELPSWVSCPWSIVKLETGKRS